MTICVKHYGNRTRTNPLDNNIFLSVQFKREKNSKRHPKLLSLKLKRRLWFVSKPDSVFFFSKQDFDPVFLHKIKRQNMNEYEST